MQASNDSIIRYKWDTETSTGYRLRFDSRRANQGLKGSFRIEDWEHNSVVNDWGCDSLDEALKVLGRLFAINTRKERELLTRRLQLRAA